MGSTTTPPHTGADRQQRNVLQPEWRPGQPIDRTGCPGHRHGTASAARKAGCQCADAYLDLRRMWKRSRTGRHVPTAPAVGVARRLQGLAAAGWSGTLLATRLGCSNVRVRELREGISAAVTPATWQRVHDLTEQLRRHEPPTATGHQLGIATRTQRQAAERGWAPLDAWLPGEIDDPDALSDLDYRRTGTARPRSGAEYLELHEVLGLAVEDIARDREVTAEAVETGIRRERIREDVLNRPQPDDPIVVNALCRVLAGEGIRPVAREMGLSHSRLVNILAGRWRPVLLEQARSQFGRSEPVRYDSPAQPPTATTAPHKEGSAA